MIKMNEILIATNNPGKLREIKELLKSLPIKIIAPRDLEISIEVDEDGKTYFENAYKKAIAYQKASGGVLTLADDSGLEVAALDGLPGINSHRFSAKQNASDLDRRISLLERLLGHPEPWNACFHCEIVIMGSSGNCFRAHGKCEGEIIANERGTNGFGYDPIFYLPQKGKTMAELTDQEKNQVSHRANAIKKALTYLRSLSISEE